MSQAVSDLTSATSPSLQVSRGLATVYNLFACLSCVLVSLVVENKCTRLFQIGVYLFALMNWVSGIGYSLFPLSNTGYAGQIQDVMHLIVTVIVVLLSIISLNFIIIGGLKQKQGKSISIVAAFALLCMFIGAVGVNMVPQTYFGLVERFGGYSAVTFNAILGLYGFSDFNNMNTVSGSV